MVLYVNVDPQELVVHVAPEVIQHAAVSAIQRGEVQYLVLGQQLVAAAVRSAVLVAVGMSYPAERPHAGT